MTKLKKPERLLTEVELELMNAVWMSEGCTVRDVVERLPEGRSLAYTSVATMMKILEEKGVLRSEKKEKTHTYFPLISREEYESKMLKHVATKVFNGSPSSMVMRLLDEAELTKEELKLIRKTLEERMRS